MRIHFFRIGLAAFILLVPVVRPEAGSALAGAARTFTRVTQTDVPAVLTVGRLSASGVKSWTSEGTAAAEPRPFGAFTEGTGAPRVTTGDYDGDGSTDIIVGSPGGIINRVKVFNQSNQLIDQFRPFEKSYHGGVDVAVMDLDANGTDEVISCKMKRKSELKVSANHVALLSLTPFEARANGCRVSAGDLDGDSLPEMIVGSGGDVTAKVEVYALDGSESDIWIQPFGRSFTGAVDVAAGDLDGDGTDEIALVRQSDGRVTVKAYTYLSALPVLLSFQAFGKRYQQGGSIDLLDLDGDGFDEVLIGLGAGTVAKIRAFNATEILWTIEPYGDRFKNGTDVSGMGID